VPKGYTLDIKREKSPGDKLAHNQDHEEVGKNKRFRV
jgi:hypothetical protein